MNNKKSKTKPQRTVRLGISQPPDWIAAWEAEANRQGIDLSQWIGLACNAQLPLAVRKALSDRIGRGRPTKTKGERT